MSVLHLPVTADVLLLCPGASLKDQVDLWAVRHPEWRVERSQGWSPPETRPLLRYAGTALVDATADPVRAREAFLLAVARLGASAVAMYTETMHTETMHDSLELFVRVRGALFLLGPLGDEQWEEYFQRTLRTKRACPASSIPALQRPRFSHSVDYGIRQRAMVMNRFRAGLGWTMTDRN